MEEVLPLVLKRYEFEKRGVSKVRALLRCFAVPEMTGREHNRLFFIE